MLQGGLQTAQAPLALNTGMLSINLSAYSTTTDIQTLLSNYTDTAGLNTILVGYTTTTALNTLLTNYVLSTTLPSMLANYTDATALNTLLGNYVLTTTSNNTLANYTDTTGLNALLSNYTDTTALNTLLGNYILTTTLNNTLANYTDTTALNALLGNYVLATTLNNTLSSYTDTSALTTLLSNKQDNLSVTGQGVFLDGSVLNGYDLRWNTSNTPTAPIHCLRFEDLSVVQNLNLTSGQLELQVSASNKQDNISVTLPLTLTGNTIDTLWKPSNLSVSTGLGVTSNDTAGTSFLYLTGTESRVALKLQDSNSVVKDLTHSTTGRLIWDGADVETKTTLAPLLALKQSTLSYYSEATANTGIVQYQYGPTNIPAWALAYYTNNGI